MQKVEGSSPFSRSSETPAPPGVFRVRRTGRPGHRGAHNGHFHQTGTKRPHHPVFGDLELAYEVMDLSAGTGLTIAVTTAEPGSRSQPALDLPASWTATPT